MDDQALADFLDVAAGEYQLITPDAPLPCFALLLGSAEATTYHVRHIAFGRNARTTDPAAQQEFRETIVPKFGPAYENEHRGWWMDSHDVLRASHEAEALGLDLLGFNHFGFHIEDTAATSEALVAAGTPKPAERFTNRPFAEYRAMDPEGNWFDLSEHGFGGPRPPSDSAGS